MANIMPYVPGMWHVLADVIAKLLADVIAMLYVVDVITTRQMV